MVDLLIEQAFLLFWLVVFYVFIYGCQRFIPKGFLWAQIIFLLTWRILPYYEIHSLGFLPYRDIPVYWLIAAMLFLFFNGKSRRRK